MPHELQRGLLVVERAAPLPIVARQAGLCNRRLTEAQGDESCPAARSYKERADRRTKCLKEDNE